MHRPYIDLHVHSYYSDGSMSPEELVASAAEHRVGVLALADHDLADGAKGLRSVCKQRSILPVAAVEIDSLERGQYYHIVAYGFDLENREFGQFLSHVRFMLDESNVRLIEAMAEEIPEISLDEYMRYSHDRRLGGWKALHYFVAKGITSSLKEGILLYPRYGITREVCGYPSIGSICWHIKKAGGYAVLAHPGEMIDTADIAAFFAKLHRLVCLGLDGVECYYPSHSPEVTKACVDLCREKDLLITAGSDCHGVFTNTRVGEMNITHEQLHLKDLLAR